jgi:ABC-type multidrug transport system fused ATPase/permease subunit
MNAAKDRETKKARKEQLKKRLDEKKRERKEEFRRKPKYGMFSCLKWMLDYTRAESKLMAFCALAVIPLALILYALGLYTPSIILDRLENAGAFNQVALIIIALLGAHLVFRITKNFVDAVRRKMNNRLNWLLILDIKSHAWRLGYQWFLYSENEKKQNRAFNAARSEFSFLHEAANMLVNIICFALFGSLVATLDVRIFVMIAAGVVINFLMSRWFQDREYYMEPENDIYEKKHKYLIHDVSGDYAYSKDIRVFNMLGLIDYLIKDAADGRRRIYKKTSYYRTVMIYVSGAVVAVRDGLAYYFLIQKAISGELNASEFVLYFSAVSQLSDFMNGLLNQVFGIRKQALAVSDLREYLDMENGFRHGGGIPVDTSSPVEVEFKNVSFKYPEGETDVLKNVSFKIERGEKIALVGVNGAGKTTLTLLMCGVLTPTEGEVFINGHDLNEYDIDELHGLFSLLPQGIYNVAASIAENIAMCDRAEIDEERLYKCLELAGLKERVAAMPKGVDQPMVKRFDEDAVDLSGGEQQKLLLARTLYRDTPMLILDEPTAALDPIAEDEIYRKYGEMTQGKTSVYISHRLASTRFCDRILMLDGAVIAESGTHEELMARGGKYAEMFEVQSKYYKEGAEGGDDNG